MKPGSNALVVDTKQRIIEAALVCVQRWGVEKTNLNDIAREAGVTRPTVYSYFGNRDDVIKAALLQSGYRFAERVIAYIQDYEGAGTRIVESILFTLRELPREPELMLVTDSGMAHIINSSALSTEEGLELCIALFKEMLKGEDSLLNDVDEISEVSTRFLLSLVTLQDARPRTEEEMRAFLRRRLLPALGLS